MNKTIWKFPLLLQDSQSVSMPEEAEILTVQSQDGSLVLWAMVNPELPKVDRVFEVHGTGNPVYYDVHGLFGVLREYIGTVQQPPFVWHVFERVS